MSSLLPLVLMTASLAGAGAGCRPAAVPVETPRPLPPIAPVNGSNALARVAELVARGPRDAGTPGGGAAAEWIAASLTAMGLEAAIDRFEDPTPEGPRLFRNVLAKRPGRGDGWIVLLSHFDTKSGIAPGFAGANDSGSSTGLLLELASMAASGHVEGNLLFGFLDGEECRISYGPNDGLHGSRRLARQLRARGEKVEAVILLDMVGDADLRITLPRNVTPRLALLLFDVAQRLGCRDRVTLSPHDMLDDHQPFLDAGYAAIDLIDFEYGSAPGRNDYWHTPADTLDKLSAGSLQLVGNLTLAMVAALAASM